MTLTERQACAACSQGDLNRAAMTQAALTIERALLAYR